MIRRFRIMGYKSLRDVEVHLQPLTVLFGPNAAGKSNFLDALQVLARMVTSRTLKDAFEPPYRGTPVESFSFGPGGMAGALKEDRLEATMELDVELSPRTIERVEDEVAEMRSGSQADGGKPGPRIKEKLLRYRLRIEVLPRSGILRVVDESLAALLDNGRVKASRNAFIEQKDRQLRLRMEGQGHPTHHEVGLDHTLVSRPLYPPHYPHVTAFRRELEDWSFFYFEPRERMRAKNPVKEVRHIGLMGEELAAFLNTMKTVDARQFNVIEKALRTLVPRIEGIDVAPNAIGEVELQLHEDGVPVPARLVSEGTLRMLGLLAVASSKEPSTLIAFEEPENGIHPRRIRLLAEFLKSRVSNGNTQFIVTTHSPLLADLLPHESLYVCKREAASTAIQPLTHLFAPAEIHDALEGDDDRMPVSQRIIRGDFDD